MKRTLAAITFALFLLLSVESFSETRQEQMYRLAGIKTQEQKAIDNLTMETESLKREVDDLHGELDILRERVHILEIRTSR